MRRPAPLLASLALVAWLTGCGGPSAEPSTRTPEVVLSSAPVTSSAPVASAAPRALPSRPWSSAWTPQPSFRGAHHIFSATMTVCAATSTGVRCLDPSTRLGPLAGTDITSPTGVWSFVYLCGVAPGNTHVCSHPFADRLPQGPTRLESIVSVDIHAAAHADGTMSVTSNRDFTGYVDPRWAKVRAVTDAVQVASSWYATQSCYLRRSGEVACVEHAVDATPRPVAGVSDATRIWKTDEALWALTKGGRLLATRSPASPFTEVATDIVQMTPNAAAAPGAVAADKGDVACAVDRTGHLLCGLDRSWKLTPVEGAGTTQAVHGDYNWICARDDKETTRCIQKEGP